MYGYTHTLRLHGLGESEPEWLAVPASAAVVVFESADRAVLIATTADARSLVRRRLRSAEESDEIVAGASGPVADLRPVTERVSVVAVGSAFEAEWVYLSLARRLMPEVYRAVAERWRAWFVHVDPAAEYPRFSKSQLSGADEGRVGLVAARSASTAVNANVAGLDGGGESGSGLLFGPLSDKDAAGRFIEAIVDGFDLCRFHHLLQQSPNASACAYKEIGRCASPCDGSETMSSYRTRVTGSVAWMQDGEVEFDATEGEACVDKHVALPVLVEGLRACMAKEAAAGEFERAAAVRDRIARLETLEHKRFVGVRELRDCRWLIVPPPAANGLLRAFVCLCGKMEMVVEAQSDDAIASAPVIAIAVADACSRFEFCGVDQEEADNLGLLARWLRQSRSAKSTRSAGVIMPVSAKGEVQTEALVAGLRGLMRRGRAASDSSVVDEQELGL